MSERMTQMIEASLLVDGTTSAEELFDKADYLDALLQLLSDNKVDFERGLSDPTKIEPDWERLMEEEKITKLIVLHQSLRIGKLVGNEIYRKLFTR